MSSFDVCYNFMMINEDGPAPYRYKCVDDTGGFAISGINSASFPDEFQIIAGIPQADRGSWVEQFYRLHFWSDWYEQLVSDEVAKRVFDSAVNMGSRTACKLLQQAINSLAQDIPVKEDAQWGANTVKWANACHPEELANAFRQKRLDYYSEIVERNPATARYLGTAKKPGPWWIRAAK